MGIEYFTPLHAKVGKFLEDESKRQHVFKTKTDLRRWINVFAAKPGRISVKELDAIIERLEINTTTLFISED